MMAWIRRQERSRFQPCVYQRAGAARPSCAALRRSRLLMTGSDGRQGDVDMERLFDRLERLEEAVRIDRARQIEAYFHLVERRAGGRGRLQMGGQLQDVAAGVGARPSRSGHDSRLGLAHRPPQERPAARGRRRPRALLDRLDEDRHPLLVLQVLAGHVQAFVQVVTSAGEQEHRGELASEVDHAARLEVAAQIEYHLRQVGDDPGAILSDGGQNEVASHGATIVDQDRTKSPHFEVPASPRHHRLWDRVSLAPIRHPLSLPRRGETSVDSRMARLFEEGSVLFNRAQFFEAHEVWEDAWRRARGEDEALLHGLIQVAAGFHKLQCGQPSGAASLLTKGNAKLAAIPGGVPVPALPAFRASVETWNAGSAGTGTPPGIAASFASRSEEHTSELH